MATKTKQAAPKYEFSYQAPEELRVLRQRRHELQEQLKGLGAERERVAGRYGDARARVLEMETLALIGDIGPEQMEAARADVRRAQEEYENLKDTPIHKALKMIDERIQQTEADAKAQAVREFRSIYGQALSDFLTAAESLREANEELQRLWDTGAHPLGLFQYPRPWPELRRAPGDPNPCKLERMARDAREYGLLPEEQANTFLARFFPKKRPA